jgi:nicotinamidase-related amidase
MKYIKKVLKWAGVLLLIIIGVPLINYLIFNKSCKKISEGAPIAKNDKNKPALMVIDIQEGTTGKVSTYKHFITNSDSLVQKVNRIIEKSNDNNVLIVYVRNEISNPLLNMLNNSLAKGSEGAKLDHRLLIVNDNIISKKKMDSFSNPDLDKLLTENRINQLYFVGLDAAYCVNSTIDAAINREYKISAISDGIFSATDSLKKQMLGEYINKGVNLLTAEEYFLELEGGE